MNIKKRYLYIVLFLVAIYTFTGFIFFGKGKETNIQKTHLENNKGQKSALQMSDTESKAKETVLGIEKERKEGILDENTLLEQIEISKEYLVDNLNAVSLNNDCYMELLYHSSFLELLGEKYKLGGNALMRSANEIHTYVVNAADSKSDAERERELRVSLQEITEEQIYKVVENIKK